MGMLKNEMEALREVVREDYTDHQLRAFYSLIPIATLAGTAVL